MKPIRVAFAVLVALFALAAAACGGDEQSIPAGAVAVVDGTPITQEALDGLLARAKVSYKAQKRDFPKAGTPEYQQLQQQGVSFLVQRAEFANRAADLDLTVTDKEITDRIATVVKETYAGDQKKFDAAMKEQGYDLAALRADIQATMLSEKLYDAVTKDVKVSDADIAAFYDTNKVRFAESRDVRHILVALDKNGQPVDSSKGTVVDYAKSKALADRVYDELKGGADFAALAKKYSNDPGSKDLGGKLTITRGQTVPEFDSTAFLLPLNALSRPVKTEFGYHVIQPTSAVKPATSLKAARPAIVAELLDPKKKEAVTKWSETAQKYFADKVSYAPGFVPPPAATGPVATTTG